MLFAVKIRLLPDHFITAYRLLCSDFCLFMTETKNLYVYQSPPPPLGPGPPVRAGPLIQIQDRFTDSAITD